MVWEQDIGSKVLFGVQGFFQKISEGFVLLALGELLM